MSIPDDIQTAIRASGLRQNKICKIYNATEPKHMRISDPTLTRWKQGAVDPPASKLQKLLLVLNNISSNEKMQEKIS